RADRPGVIDFHVHTAPSLLPRHHTDREIGALMARAGVARFVLKAHEGSTAERASLTGGGAEGSITLNSPVGGANPEAVRVAAALGARVVWMPTISSTTHRAHRGDRELTVHSVEFSAVPVSADGVLLDQWHDVLDVVARSDLVLASGHIAIDDAVLVF